MNRQSAAVTASVAAAMLLAACGSQNPVSTGRWPSNPESTPQQAFVTTPGAGAPAVVRVPTKQHAAAGTVTQNTTVTHTTRSRSPPKPTPAQAPRGN